MSLLEVGDVVGKVGKAIDDNTESGEERQQQLSNRHAVDMASDKIKYLEFEKKTFYTDKELIKSKIDIREL